MQFLAQLMSHSARVQSPIDYIDSPVQHVRWEESRTERGSLSQEYAQLPWLNALHQFKKDILLELKSPSDVKGTKGLRLLKAKQRRLKLKLLKDLESGLIFLLEGGEGL